MQTMIGRARSKWVTGLRPRLEDVFSKGVSRGTLFGRAALRGVDMLEVVEIKFIPGSPEGPSFEVEGREVLFKYPVKGGEALDDVYYPLMGMLNRV